MSIQELIDNELLRGQEERKDRIRSGKWSPSSFGKCFRNQYWNRLNVPITNPPDTRSLRVFRCGSLFEKFAIDLLIKQNPSIQTQVLIEDDEVKGFADIVDDDSVADIKSVHSRAFWYMEKCQDIAKEKYNNWLQVGWYAWKLENKKFLKLIFISKDDLTIAEYTQVLDDYWKNEIDMELTKLDWYWKEKTIPPAEPRLFGGGEKLKAKECEYCGFKDLCKEKESK